MFGIGTWEFLIIGIVLLLVVGPKGLPSLFKKVGMVVGEVRHASRELRNQLDVEVRDIQKELENQKSDLLNTKDELLSEIEDPYEKLVQSKTDIINEFKSPYDEAEQADREFQRELQKDKANFLHQKQQSGSNTPSDDTDTSTSDTLTPDNRKDPAEQSYAQAAQDARNTHSVATDKTNSPSIERKDNHILKSGHATAATSKQAAAEENDH